MLALHLLMHLTHVQLHVVFQRELFWAAWALVGFGAVRLLVGVQRGWGRQVFGAKWARVVADAQMRALLMHRFRAVLRERFVAEAALVWAFPRVRSLVHLQRRFLRKTFVAKMAAKGFFTWGSEGKKRLQNILDKKFLKLAVCQICTFEPEFEMVCCF